MKMYRAKIYIQRGKLQIVYHGVHSSLKGAFSAAKKRAERRGTPAYEGRYEIFDGFGHVIIEDSLPADQSMFASLEKLEEILSTKRGQPVEEQKVTRDEVVTLLRAYAASRDDESSLSLAEISSGVDEYWSCTIGPVRRFELNEGSDFPIRRAVIQAFEELVGRPALVVFSGWGQRLTRWQQHFFEHIKEQEKKKKS